ncbi:MAG: hypothetical protein ACOH1V_08290 [Stenotrophomonas sp.]
MNSIFAIAGSGMRGAIQDLRTAAEVVAGRTQAESPGYEITPAVTALVAALPAQTAFAANATVIRRGEEMLGSLLDTFA